MNQIPPETRRIQSLLTSLIIVSILIIGLVLIIAAYPTILRPFLAPATPPGPSPRPSNTITITPTITPTPTQTRTLRPTLTPSITPTPTGTLPATSTPTPPGPPTLTPAQPVKSDPYKFTEWTSDLANLSIELMKDYPNTLIPRLRGDDNRGYYEAFYYATIAEKEGLMRFPEAPQALQWQYSLAYNLAQMGDPQAGEAYAALITQALNQGEVYLEGLPVWFQLLEPRLTVNHIQLEPPSGYLSSHILEIHGPGSAFIWLLETPSGYQANVLDSNFDFVQAPEMRLIVSDFNGDGIDDAAIFNSSPDGTNLEKPRIFDLSEMPATELSFRPSDPIFQPGIDYINNWRPAKATTTAETPTTLDGSDLMLELRLFPACPVTVRQTFHWNGTYFELAQSDFEVEPAPGTLSLCRIIVDHAADLWGPQAAVQIMEQLLSDWPPAMDEEGKPYPADAKDEWRLRLGIYHALLGNFDQAVGYFNELVEKPSQPNSRWVEPAKQFLSLYRSPQDVYRACVENQFCDPNRALDYLVNQLGIPDGQDPVEFLNQNGVTLRSSGYFDFDGDEVKERWITIRHHPLEKLDLWVLAAAKDGLRAIEVSQVEGDRPNLQFLNEDEKPPIIWVDSGVFVTFGRDTDSGQPYLTLVSPKLEFPNRFREGLDQARQALFAGEDLNIVLDLLVGLETSPGLLCKSNWTCDEYYYLLGLTNELLGNQRAAIEAFLTLWRDYSRSPFTTLARLKLARTRELPTPIPTSTLTAFPTSLLTPRTPTATLTLAPGLTPSVTPVPSSTLPVDVSLTPTLTSPAPYLYPTVTRRPTATSQPYQ